MALKPVALKAAVATNPEAPANRAEEQLATRGGVKSALSVGHFHNYGGAGSRLRTVKRRQCRAPASAGY